jgi:hypothetical protein
MYEPVRVVLYTESRWQRFKRKVLRRKNPWSGAPDGTLVNTEPVTFYSTGAEVVTHVSVTFLDGHTVEVPINAEEEEKR